MCSPRWCADLLRLLWLRLHHLCNAESTRRALRLDACRRALEMQAYRGSRAVRLRRWYPPAPVEVNAATVARIKAIQNAPRVVAPPQPQQETKRLPFRKRA